jgi:hypothetical protein
VEAPCALTKGIASTAVWYMHGYKMGSDLEYVFGGGIGFIIRKDLEARMTLLEQIEKQLSALPPEKQNEVLDFIAFLQQRTHILQKRRPLKKHTAFGSWKNRKIDAIKYQRDLRAEWKM